MRRAGEPAGLATRGAALFIDFWVVAIAALVFKQALEAGGAMVPGRVLLLWRIRPLVEALSTFFIGWGYMAGAWVLTGQTLGKRLLGVEVVSVGGGKPSVVDASLRFLAYAISAFPLLAGFWWVLFDRTRRAWHDRIAGTKVVYAKARTVRRVGTAVGGGPR